MGQKMKFVLSLFQQTLQSDNFFKLTKIFHNDTYKVL